MLIIFTKIMDGINEIRLLDDCVKIIDKNRSSYIPSEKISNEIDNYYDNYEDIKQSLEDEFIKYVRNKIITDEHSMNRYKTYGLKELEHWFYDDDFKDNLNKNIRDLSNLEYYVYLSNKTNKEKIKDLEFKIFYISFLFIMVCLTNIFNHISID